MIISFQALAGAGGSQQAKNDHGIDVQLALSAAVIVAHPDDETIWAGGTIIGSRDYSWNVFTICRRSDPDRAPKFKKALEHFGAKGAMGDLDDGPDQQPLEQELVSEAILKLLPRRQFDLVFTHGPHGEYRRHRRHEETYRAVAGLWRAGMIQTRELRTFAYIYDEHRGLSLPDLEADIVNSLPDNIYAEKRLIMESIYVFGPDSFEIKTLSRTETFNKISDPAQLGKTGKGARPI